jgi:hypothetical protein
LREDDIKRMRVVRAYLVVNNGLLEEELDVVGYREACRAMLTTNQIEQALLEGLDGGFPAAGLKGFYSHGGSVLEFIVKE